QCRYRGGDPFLPDDSGRRQPERTKVALEFTQGAGFLLDRAKHARFTRTPRAPATRGGRSRPHQPLRDLLGCHALPFSLRAPGPLSLLHRLPVALAPVTLGQDRMGRGVRTSTARPCPTHLGPCRGGGSEAPREALLARTCRAGSRAGANDR